MAPLRPIVILGPTAGGKSALAVELAHALTSVDGKPGQVLSADSMQVYRHMDAGTAKPSLAQRAAAKHHLIDVAEPTERFTVSDWRDLAEPLINQLRQQAIRPIIVGGTNLYLKVLLEGMFQGPAIDRAFRQSLSNVDVHQLHDQLQQVDPAAARRIHPNDRKRITRALEVYHLTGRPISDLQQQWRDDDGDGYDDQARTEESHDTSHGETAAAGVEADASEVDQSGPDADVQADADAAVDSGLRADAEASGRREMLRADAEASGRREMLRARYRFNPILIGLRWPSEAINPRINLRVRAMFFPEKVEPELASEVCPNGESLPDEVQRLESCQLLGPQAREALGYKQVLDALAGNSTMEDAFEQTKIQTRRFAKQQRTWLKRFSGVHWIDAHLTPQHHWLDQARQSLEQ